MHGLGNRQSAIGVADWPKRSGLRGLGLFTSRPSTAMTFCRSFQTSAFAAGIAQQICGMVRGHQFSATKVEPFAAEMGNAAIGFQQSLRGDAAEADDYFGLRSRPSAGTRMASRFRLRLFPARDFPAGGTSPRCRCKRRCAAGPWLRSFASAVFRRGPRMAGLAHLRRGPGLRRRKPAARWDFHRRRQFWCGRGAVCSGCNRRCLRELSARVSSAILSGTSNSETSRHNSGAAEYDVLAAGEVCILGVVASADAGLRARSEARLSQVGKQVADGAKRSR